MLVEIEANSNKFIDKSKIIGCDITVKEPTEKEPTGKVWLGFKMENVKDPLFYDAKTKENALKIMNNLYGS